MTAVLSEAQLRWLRLRAQALTPRDALAPVATIVREVAGLQAQDAAAAALAIRARGAAADAADVERARVEERSIVRTWAMRGTLHLLAAEDVGWVVALVGPPALAGARRRQATLGVDGETGARGVRLIRAALAGRGPLTRAELAGSLTPHGIPTAGQAIVHLIGRAALEGLVCLGPARGREPTYVLVDDWLGRDRPPARADSPPAREAALAELARRYLAAYGPARPEDLAAWSGLPMGDARAGWQRIAGELLAITTASGPAWLLARHADRLADPASRSLVVRLLPSFDTLLLGYRGREWVVAPEHGRRIHPGGGILRPVLLVDGQAAGTWRLARRRDHLAVVVEPFAPLAPAVVAGVETEVASIGRFLGRPAGLTLMARPGRGSPGDGGGSA